MCDLENVDQGYGIQLSHYDDKHITLRNIYLSFLIVTSRFNAAMFTNRLHTKIY